MNTNYLFLLIFLTSMSLFPQKHLVSDEEFNSRISWLEPHEEHLEFDNVLKKIPGVNNKYELTYRLTEIGGGGIRVMVDGILYSAPPQRLYASQVKYVEVVNSGLQSNACQCSLIIKTAVTEKELNSRKNILNRLNKIEKPKKKKKKKRGKKN